MGGQYQKTENSEDTQNRMDKSMNIAANRKCRRHGRKETFFLLQRLTAHKTPAQFIDPRHANEQTWYALFRYSVKPTKVVFYI